LTEQIDEIEPECNKAMNVSVTEPMRLVLAGAAGAGQRVDVYLVQALSGQGVVVSRSRLQRWINLGAVLLDGEHALAASYRLKGHEQIEVSCLPLQAEESFHPDPVALDIQAQSKHWWVINKPAGLVTHPGAGNWRGTLMNGLLHLDEAQAQLPRAGIVHRLDKDTSGLLVVARTELARQAFTEQLANRSMGRVYLAWCSGALSQAITIDGPIGRDTHNRLRMAVDLVHGKPARTAVLPLANVQYQGKSYSLVACKLFTGRTHQIRVHLAHHQHRLVGDALYGGSTDIFNRQALHAWQLGFDDPSSQQHCGFEAEPPADFLALGTRLLHGPQPWLEPVVRQKIASWLAGTFLQGAKHD
jgi:23S rRNA pseudouridine1911/1915/1917 synthase